MGLGYYLSEELVKHEETGQLLTNRTWVNITYLKLFTIIILHYLESKLTLIKLACENEIL